MVSLYGSFYVWVCWILKPNTLFWRYQIEINYVVFIEFPLLWDIILWLSTFRRRCLKEGSTFINKRKMNHELYFAPSNEQKTFPYFTTLNNDTKYFQTIVLYIQLLFHYLETYQTFVTKYSRMIQVKFVEDSL